MDWYDEIKVNNNLKITLLPHSLVKKSLTDTNKTLWGNFLIQYKDKKYFLHVTLDMEIFIKILVRSMVQSIYL